MTRLQASEIKMKTSCVLTIGKFESIHAGHQKLFAEVLRRSKELNIPSGAITFDPHPSVLFGQPGYQSLFTADEREHIMGGLGLDYMIVFPFDEAFASQTPEEFSARLFDGLRVKALVVGEGFRFGKGNAGTVEILRREAAGRGAEVIAIPHQNAGEGVKISTSDIRKLVTGREFERAAVVMGFPFFIMGTVNYGKQIGQTMGYPTVNILPAEDKLLPADGVYATRTYFGSESFLSVTNVGVRPTVNSVQTERTVESFLIGFNGDLYGAALRTEFVHFIRLEKKFGSIDGLKTQISKDVAYAKELCADG